MRRRIAINLLKKIGASCRYLNPRTILLERTAEDGSYELHINANIDDESWESLKILVKSNNLELKLNGSSLVVCEPLSKKYGKLIFA